MLLKERYERSTANLTAPANLTVGRPPRRWGSRELVWFLLAVSVDLSSFESRFGSGRWLCTSCSAYSVPGSSTGTNEEQQAHGRIEAVEERDRFQRINTKSEFSGEGVEDNDSRLMMHRAHIFVTGKVQGVYYRDSTKRKADMLGLVGAAWNLADGRVEIIAEGPKDKLDELENWCHKGPEGAAEVGLENDLSAKRRVDKVEIVFEDAKGDLGKKFKNAGKK